VLDSGLRQKLRTFAARVRERSQVKGRKRMFLSGGGGSSHLVTYFRSVEETCTP
jgi:hypothetical protein